MVKQLTSGQRLGEHRFRAPSIGSVPLRRLIADGGEMGEGACSSSSHSVTCLEHRDASRLWPREPHPAWLLFPGDLTPVPQSLRVNLSQEWTAWAIPPSHGGSPKALENTDILFHFSCLKMQPYPKGKQSSPSLLLKGSCPLAGPVPSST